MNDVEQLCNNFDDDPSRGSPVIEVQRSRAGGGASMLSKIALDALGVEGC